MGSKTARRFTFLFSFALLFGCIRNDAFQNSVLPQGPVGLEIIRVFATDDAVQAGQDLTLNLEIQNPTDSDKALKSVSVRISRLGSNITEQELVLAVEQRVKAGDTLKLQRVVWNIPSGAATDAYGVFARIDSEDGTNVAYKPYTFFRIPRKDELLVYDIAHRPYGNISMFSLDGGLSAEFAVEKSLESMLAGISHSWYVSKTGYGPNPVVSTSDFLDRAVSQTIHLYDSVLGGKAIETVVIGSGIPSASYLAHTFDAPFLPLHFLVSVNTIVEVQAIVENAVKNGIPAYATLGYDGSITPAVAWIKLLDLPDVYLDFLNRHSVKNVILLGYAGSADGENMARKVVDENEGGRYFPETVYILHPQGGNASDDVMLRQKIKDFDSHRLGTLVKIADWESGIIEEQVSSFTNAIRSRTNTNSIRFVTSKNDIPLWDLATYVSIAFAKKNQQHLKYPLKEITLNPYLIGHPFFESYSGRIPLLYWQGNPASSTVARMKQTVQKGLDVYFPGYIWSDISVLVNSSNNFGGADAAKQMEQVLLKEGYKCRLGSINVDEVWNAADGMDSPCERHLLTLIDEGADVKEISKKLEPLGLEELQVIAEKFGNIIVTDY